MAALLIACIIQASISCSTIWRGAQRAADDFRSVGATGPARVAQIVGVFLCAIQALPLLITASMM